jgi:general secretion pathway protein F
MRYRVTGLDADRGIAIHEMDAADEADARRQAQARGLRILTLESSRLRLSGRRARLGLVPFTNELVALLEAGLSLTEAIDALTEKERDAAVRAVLEGIRDRLYEGRSLSSALGEFPGSFPTLYVATVRASERSGSISQALQRFVAYQERIDLLKRQLINASIYPAVLLAVGTLVVLFLVAYVVPRFAGIYEEIGGDLPLASRILMRWGQLLETHGLLMLAGGGALLGAVVLIVTQRSTREGVGRLIARIPNISHQLQLYQLARLYRTSGMLLRGGLPVVTAFDMTRGLLPAAAQPRLAAATRAVREGQSLTDSLTRHALTTPVAERMLRVGERSGNMGEMMERVADFYDTELSRWVDVATRLIEPVMMTMIGLLIGGIVVLMYFPIFELAGSIR